MGIKNAVDGYVDAPPDRVFSAVTDVANLPSWNDRMTKVVEQPDQLVEGAQWVVGFKVAGRRFNSRSKVIELDPVGRRFVYRSKPDDDNPSHTVWTWEVLPEGSGSRVRLSWHLRPLTLMRKGVTAPLRNRMMERKEVPRSLAALAQACQVAPNGGAG